MFFRSPHTTRLFSVIFLGVALSACAAFPHREREDSLLMPQAHGVEVGTASWYGGPDIGRLTACGERYRRTDVTAAHRRIPFNTQVLVTNLKNGKKVVVRVNDRGPYIKGRIIDLSYEAAKQIDIVHSGVTKVRLQILEPVPVMKGPNLHPGEDLQKYTSGHFPSFPSS